MRLRLNPWDKDLINDIKINPIRLRLNPWD